MEFPPNLFHGLVTHVIDPDNFWILYGTDNDIQLYTDYQQKLDAFYNTNGHVYTCDGDSLYREACVVVADDADISLSNKSTTCHWKRAQVLQWDRSTNTVDVRFIDLGYSAIVGRNQLRQGLLQLFQILSPQAIPVSLASIKPLAQSWTSRAKSFFEAQVLNKDILVSFVMKDDSSGHHAIVLYTQTSGGLWHSLIHEMMKEELALMTENTTAEFMSKEEANMCLQHMNEIQSQPVSMEEELLTSAEGEEETETVNAFDEELESSSISACAHTEQESMYEEVPGNVSQSFNHSRVSGQEEKASSKVIPNVDLDSLVQRTSFSLTKLQQDRQDDIKRRARAHIMASIDTADAASVSEEQDWEAVRDFDLYDDIESQIYKGVHRQISDVEVAEFVSGLEQLSRGIVRPVESRPSDNDAPDTFDHRLVTDNEVGNAEMVKKSSQGTRSPEFDNTKADQEIHDYQIIKKIQEILSDYVSEGADVASASIHSIVEPDVDVSSEELSIVLYALLEHSIGKSIQDQEMVLAILETYSDTSCFAQAMRDVLIKLKDQYVKQVKSVRLNSKHKDFAEMLSLVLTYSSDWDERPAKDVQEFILCLVSNWIIFNKSRRESESKVFDSELIYLESAEVVLSKCFEQVKEMFPETLADIMVETRHKLVHDSSPRWIRERLLDLLLNIKCDTDVFRQGRKTCNAATQTAKDTGFTHGGPSTPYSNRDQSKHIEDSFALNTSSPEADEVSPPLGRSQDTTPVHNTSFSYHEQTSLRKDTTGETALERYFYKASEDVLKTRRYSSDEMDRSSSSPVFPVDFPPGSFVPAELASVTAHSKKRGVPKSLRNLPPRLLRKCQKDLPTQNLSNQDEIYSVEPVSDLHTGLDLVSDADYLPGYQPPLSDVQNQSIRSASPSQTQESTETPVIGLTDAEPPTLEKRVDCDFSEGFNFLEREKTGEGIMPEEEPQNFVKDSTALESVISSTYDIRRSPHDYLLEERDDQLSETNTGIANSTNIIVKYSTFQLREMNPYKSSRPLALEELWEPSELLTKMIARNRKLETRNEIKCSDEMNANLRLSPKQLGRLDEINRTSSPTTGDITKLEACSTGDNFSTDMLDSQSSMFKTETVSEDDATCQNDHNTPTLPNTLADTNVSTDELEVTGDLKDDTGKDLLFPSSTEVNLKIENDSPAAPDEPAEIWHENKGDNCDMRDLLDVKDTLGDGKKKGKKKKVKYRPIEFFKSQSPVLDQGGNVCDDVGGLDEFSPEALRMYEELEKEGKENETLYAGGDGILTQARFGGSSTSTSKRPSLFAEVRQRYQPPKNRKPWCPGRRKCTRCGSEDHTVERCEDDGSSLYKS